MASRRCVCHHRALAPVVQAHDYRWDAATDDVSDNYCTCVCHHASISGTPCSEPTYPEYEMDYRPLEACWDEVA
jgi:hypothetical protein